VEEPLEIRVDGEPIAVAMRAPGEDEELAAGFLAGESLTAGREDVASVGPTEDFAANVVEVRTRNGLRRDPSGERRFSLTSARGVCGTRVRRARGAAGQAGPAGRAGARPAPADGRARRPARLRSHRCLHATGLFEPDGRLLALREDVGRHNATVCARFQQRTRAAARCCSGRTAGVKWGPRSRPAQVGSTARRRAGLVGRWFPRRRPPNRTCEFHRIRLSMSTSGGFGSCERLLDAFDPELLLLARA
jgi:hypothetical protein